MAILRGEDKQGDYREVGRKLIDSFHKHCQVVFFPKHSAWQWGGDEMNKACSFLTEFIAQGKEAGTQIIGI